MHVSLQRLHTCNNPAGEPVVDEDMCGTHTHTRRLFISPGRVSPGCSGISSSPPRRSSVSEPTCMCGAGADYPLSSLCSLTQAAGCSVAFCRPRCCFLQPEQLVSATVSTLQPAWNEHIQRSSSFTSISASRHTLKVLSPHEVTQVKNRKQQQRARTGMRENRKHVERRRHSIPEQTGRP